MLSKYVLYLLTLIIFAYVLMNPEYITELGKIIKLDKPSIVKIQRFGKNIKIS